MYRGAFRFKRVPSVQKLEAVFGTRAAEARGILKHEIRLEKYASVQKILSNSYHTPWWIDQVMEALDEIAGTFGVEYLVEQGREAARYLYLNTGDTYAATIIFDCRDKTIRISCVGDVVEHNRNIK
jgi:hypothetical protein